MKFRDELFQDSRNIIASNASIHIGTYHILGVRCLLSCADFLSKLVKVFRTLEFTDTVIPFMTHQLFKSREDCVYDLRSERSLKTLLCVSNLCYHLSLRYLLMIFLSFCLIFSLLCDRIPTE